MTILSTVISTRPGSNRPIVRGPAELVSLHGQSSDQYLSRRIAGHGNYFDYVPAGRRKFCTHAPARTPSSPVAQLVRSPRTLCRLHAPGTHAPERAFPSVVSSEAPAFVLCPAQNAMHDCVVTARLDLFVMFPVCYWAFYRAEKKPFFAARSGVFDASTGFRTIRMRRLAIATVPQMRL